MGWEFQKPGLARPHPITLPPIVTALKLGIVLAGILAMRIS